MRSMLSSGLTGLLLAAALTAGAAAALDQRIDEPTPFGVIQFAPDEAWIDLAAPLHDTWTTTLTILAELQYPVTLDMNYVESGGRLEVRDLWVAVEPHGSPDAAFTRVRISLISSDRDYAQVRAEVILDAVATRLAPPAPAEVVTTGPATAAASQPAPPPVDPAYQDVYTGEPVYGYSQLPQQVYAAPGATYVSYPTPYYPNYAYYPPFGNYFPYWSCATPYSFYGSNYWLYNNSWASGVGFTYWNSPGWGYYGGGPWWNVGFSSCWDNVCVGIGYPWGGWGGCGYWGGGLVVVVGDDCDDDCDDDDHDFGNDGKNDSGKAKLADGQRADDLTAVASATPITPTAASDAVAGRGAEGAFPDIGVDGPRGMTRSNALPRIRVTDRASQPAPPRFDPRTTVTRTVDTRSAGPRHESLPTVSRGSLSTLPRTSGTTSTSPRSTTPGSSARAGTVVRMSSPSYTPGFAGVLPGASGEVRTVSGSGGGSGSVSTYTSTPYGVRTSTFTGSPYAGGASAPTPGAAPPAPTTPVPVAQLPPPSAAPAQRFIPAPAPRAPVPVSTPAFNYPAPSKPSPASIPAPSAPRASSSPAPSMPSFGGSSGGFSSGGGSSGGGGSHGSSSGSSSGSRGGRGRP